MYKCLTIIIFLLQLPDSGLYAQAGKLYPVDEASQDPSFIIFRLRLTEALVSRDTAFIIDHLSPRIKNSHGGNGGVDEFRRYWLENASDETLWSTLAGVVAAGGTYNKNASAAAGGRECGPTFSAPYYSSSWPEGVDPFGYGAAIGPDVPVYQSPDPAGRVLATLSYDLVQVTDFSPNYNQPDQNYPPGWVQVKLKGGALGFARGREVKSAVGYRATFARCDGRWIMVSFLAGD